MEFKKNGQIVHYNEHNCLVQVTNMVNNMVAKPGGEAFQVSPEDCTEPTAEQLAEWPGEINEGNENEQAGEAALTEVKEEALTGENA